MIEKTIKSGWRFVEILLILILVCLGLNIILGSGGGVFVSAVSANAETFLRNIPPGTFLGIFVILGLYWLIKKRI